MKIKTCEIMKYKKNDYRGVDIIVHEGKYYKFSKELNNSEELWEEYPLEKDNEGNLVYWYPGAKFTDIFWTPYDDQRKKIGQKFEVVKRASTDEVDAENLPQWVIRFEDGSLANAYPEEIIEKEVELQKEGYI